MLSDCYNNPFLSDFCLGKRPLRIASRKSILAQAQVHECVRLLRSWFPKLWIQIHTISTRGDKDKTTPIRLVENSQFFTDTVDKLVIRGNCHLAVHSAKDLPDPPATPVVAITKGLDPSDLLVYAERYLWQRFPKVPRLGSSSSRRGETLKMLFPTGRILDIRGTIEERLEQLENGKYDAIVVAKAAVLRLHLQLPYTKVLPPPYHPLQGRLAITAGKDIEAWKTFLLPLNTATTNQETLLSSNLICYDD
ncbi:hydroxymethylbilane synthase [Chlamydia abortus]|uniref:hydroxymethylbilane synthase n=1 Tax=Chlamydia abortus (strain DSM 27085 / S26/3) TaxID=218497 RepID=Q5L6E5_CHLAB|nr:hydroxymethylbilane synthase [Chlamydia abortus]AUS59784.1 porphobilinogen deaminase [Chlamydia abortus]QRR32027.1 hydroxymethylbilane synthase [Chlamydia abortus]CAH63781.1 putative porphobilinogen deaminase [Chlamydia abortus S26/3]CED80386.1 putative porphobilinogen deaminase [Chlamydia abortus]CED81346.1 putative porphobilinogen deaminase [Chlamydia abortus]